MLFRAVDLRFGTSADLHPTCARPACYHIVVARLTEWHNAFSLRLYAAGWGAGEATVSQKQVHEITHASIDVTYSVMVCWSSSERGDRGFQNACASLFQVVARWRLDDQATQCCIRVNLGQVTARRPCPAAGVARVTLPGDLGGHASSRSAVMRQVDCAH